ncbi:MAG: PaaI family thioesterase [Slackia sp.]|nr:PaaI family thioesterase [Slackia sp.]
MIGVEVKPLVAADATLEEVRAFFANDRYATVACGAVIDEAQAGYARVSLALGEKHLNGMGSLMGGVSFTLADFAFAVAANVGGAPTVSTNCSIDFLGTPKTDAIVAECRMEKSGRSLCFARVDVRDSAGNAVARVNVTGFRRS